jgi:hypothetical protein
MSDVVLNGIEMVYWGKNTKLFFFNRKETTLQRSYFLSQKASALTPNPVVFQAICQLPAHTGAIRLRSDS